MTEKSTYAASAQATQIDNAPQFIDLTSLNESLPPETQMMYTHTTVQGGASGGKLCSFKHSIIFIVKYFRFELLTTCSTSNTQTYAQYTVQVLANILRTTVNHRKSTIFTTIGSLRNFFISKFPSPTLTPTAYVYFVNAEIGECECSNTKTAGNRRGFRSRCRSV